MSASLSRRDRLKRRKTLLRSAMLLAIAASGFSSAIAGQDKSKADRELARIVKGKGPTDPVAAVAVAVMEGDRLIYAGAAGCAEFQAGDAERCARPFVPDTKFRVASISKMALAMGLMALVDDGKVDLDRDVSDYLGWRLVNPAFPDRPITARQLLSHTSSVRDPEEYWIAAPGRFRSLFERDEKPFAAAIDGAEFGPGAWFEYANLNYGVLAAVIEGASGRRFDLFMTDRVFKPMDLDAGYNWSGVSKPARGRGGSLPRRDGRGWTAIVDGPDVLADDLPYFLAEDGLDRASYLEAYRSGDNPTLFSPQGGLRASVGDLVLLVSTLSDDKRLSPPLWRYDAQTPNGDTEQDFYRAFGLGVQTIEGNALLFPRSEMIGHSGEAYGVHSGAWLLKADPSAGREHDVAFAFVATGVDEAPPKGAHPTFNAIEERLVRLALAVAAEKRAVSSGDEEEPGPFDGAADAMRDVDAALLAAKATGKRPLLVLGGNWCHDSRGLARKFSTPPLESLIAGNFDVIWVDVGHRDRNLDVARRFGVDRIVGTPTVLILSPEGELLNRDSTNDWRTAETKSLEDAISYFGSYAVKNP